LGEHLVLDASVHAVARRRGDVLTPGDEEPVGVDVVPDVGTARGPPRGVRPLGRRVGDLPGVAADGAVGGDAREKISSTGGASPPRAAKNSGGVPWT
jgi:hypothetical protein